MQRLFAQSYSDVSTQSAGLDVNAVKHNQKHRGDVASPGCNEKSARQNQVQMVDVESHSALSHPTNGGSNCKHRINVEPPGSLVVQVLVVPKYPIKAVSVP